MAPPIADFIADKYEAFTDEIINLYDNSQDNGSPILSYEWDISNNYDRGEIFNSKDLQVNYKWAAPYSVKLTVINADGSSSISKTINIKTKKMPSYIAKFNHPTARFGDLNNLRARFNTFVLGEGNSFIDKNISIVNVRVIKRLFSSNNKSVILNSFNKNINLSAKENKQTHIKSQNVKPLLMKTEYTNIIENKGDDI